MVITIDKTSTTPMHHQLYKIIHERIDTGFYPAGSHLPSETDLQKEFGLSRITVRRAISDLANRGHVRKHHGKGTLVLPKKNLRVLSDFASFSGDSRKLGGRVLSIILILDEIIPSLNVADNLRTKNGETVYRLVRLRTLNGELVSLQHSYIPTSLGIKISKGDFDETTSLYAFLEEHGAIPSSADETIESFAPDPEIRNQLYLDENDWVFFKERVTYNADNQPIEFSENYYRADKYRYKVHIERV